MTLACAQVNLWVLTVVRIEDISNFVLFARKGSLTRATVVSGVPKATLSHSIHRLENLLEVELSSGPRRGCT